VEESFKGIQGESAEVLVSSEGCAGPSPAYKIGGQYLVVAWENRDDRLVIYSCDPLYSAERAVADIGFLRSLQRVKPWDTSFSSRRDANPPQKTVSIPFS